MTQDLVITPLGDIQLSETGDLKITDNYNLSVVRRLSTTKQGYSRFIEDAAGIREIDAEYGSDLYNFLSDPITEISEQVLSDTVKRSLGFDPRVVILSIERELPSQNSIALTIRYRDLETGAISVATVGNLGTEDV